MDLWFAVSFVLISASALIISVRAMFSEGKRYDKNRMRSRISFYGSELRERKQNSNQISELNIRKKSNPLSFSNSLEGMLSSLFIQAGWNVDTKIYIIIKLSVIVLFATFSYITELSKLENFLAVFVIIFGPFAALYYSAAKTRSEIIKQLPDVLDGMVRSIRAGLPATAAIGQTAADSPKPISKVFSVVDENLRIGRDIDIAFDKATIDYPIPELRFLATSISIQKTTGGNMSEIIGGLSRMMRQRDRMRSKVRAMSSEARASAMIIGSLPFVMAGIIWLINPEYINVLFEDSRGQVLLGIGLSSISLGIMVIAKMINFRI